MGRLPDLVIIGAPKAGTTSIARWLAVHPQVAMSATKELEFLNLYADRGLDWYRSQLPDAPDGVLVGEATPAYLASPEAPARAAALLPDTTKYLAVLREPASRLWSNYWFFCELGVEYRSFERAMRQERAGKRLAPTTTGYLETGHYARQLERWDTAVGADRIEVLLFEDLLADPVGTYQRICRYLGIADDQVPEKTDSVNPTTRPHSMLLQYALAKGKAGSWPMDIGRKLFRWNGGGRTMPKIDPALAASLRAEFLEDNLALAERLGRELPVTWSPSGTAWPT